MQSTSINRNSISGTDSEKVAFAVSLQNQIRAQDNGAVLGWIVDLRRSSGGRCGR